MKKSNSIKQALLNKTSYTNKNKVTIPYDDLVKIKRYNDQYNYYQKQLFGKTDPRGRIKINALSSGYTRAIQNIEVKVNYMKYVRVTNKTFKTARAQGRQAARLERLQQQIERATGAPILETSGDHVLKITDIDVYRRAVQYKENMFATLNSNFRRYLTPAQYNRMLFRIEGLTLEEIHEIATNNPDLLDYVYYSPESYADKIAQFIDAINDATKRRGGAFTEDEKMAYITRILNVGG